MDIIQFDGLQEAQGLADQCRYLYNEYRPHHALGELLPLDFLAQASPLFLLFTGLI